MFFPSIKCKESRTLTENMKKSHHLNQPQFLLKRMYIVKTSINQTFNTLTKL